MSAASQAPSPQGEGWHAQFSPSASERWMTCPGSIAASRDATRTSSKYADEGTAAHLLASRCFDYGKPALFWIGESIEVNKVLWPVTEEMAEYVQAYVDDVNSRVNGGTRMHEQRVWFSETIGVEDQGGTSDAIILSAYCTSLVVEDLKYGLGVQVDATENTQLMTYALAVLETFSAIMEDVKEVTLVIHQPRLDHVSEWTCSIGRLQEHAAAIRKAASDAIRGIVELDINGKVPDELFCVSEKGCMWCPIQATCDHYRRHVSALVFDDFTVLDNPEVLEVVGTPTVPAGPTLGALSGSLDLIERWCQAVRGEIERMVLAGMEVIGPDGKPMKVVEGRQGRRTWTDVDQIKGILAGMLPPDKYLKPQPVITPAEAQKLLCKGKGAKAKFAEMFGSYVRQAPGKAHIALGSDPRPPYTPASDADEFEELGDE